MFAADELTRVILVGVVQTVGVVAIGEETIIDTFDYSSLLVSVVVVIVLRPVVVIVVRTAVVVAEQREQSYKKKFIIYAFGISYSE